MDLRLDAWRKASAKERRAIAQSIAESHPALELVRCDAGDFELAVFAHRASAFLFHLVPGGAFTMGMTDAELERLQIQYSFFEETDSADEHLGSSILRPATVIELPAFLLAARPLGGQQLEWLRASEEERQTLSRGSGSKSWNYAAVAKLPAKKYLAYLDQSGSGEVENEDVEPIEVALHVLGMRLPSDAEWERAARGGDARAFANGDTIPQTPSTGMNPFGFLDVGATAEVCADGWSETLADVPKDGSARPPAPQRTVRGGAALCWPWQGCAEWTLLACAMRKSLETEEGLLSIRPAISL